MQLKTMENIKICNISFNTMYMLYEYIVQNTYEVETIYINTYHIRNILWNKHTNNKLQHLTFNFIIIYTEIHMIVANMQLIFFLKA